MEEPFVIPDDKPCVPHDLSSGIHKECGFAAHIIATEYAPAETAGGPDMITAGVCPNFARKLPKTDKIP